MSPLNGEGGRPDGHDRASWSGGFGEGFGFHLNCIRLFLQQLCLRKSWPRHLFAATDFSGEGNMAPGHSAVYLECTYVWFPFKSRVYL